MFMFKHLRAHIIKHDNQQLQLDKQTQSILFLRMIKRIV